MFAISSILTYKPLYILIIVTAGITGALVGSFLNVCIYRLPKEHISIVTPRSRCPQCGKAILWHDNIPIISWLNLGGLCRHCRYIIPFRYTFVEILTACLFVYYTRQILLTPFDSSLFVEVGMKDRDRWIALTIGLYMVSVMVATTFIDMDYRIIPDGLTYSGIIIAPFISAWFPLLHKPIPMIEDPHLSGFIASCFGILVGGGSLYCVGVFGKMLFKKEAMGFGDVKLMAMVGGIMGWDAALLIFFLACLIGTFGGIFTVFFTKDHYLPFGPYLALGTLIVFLFKQEILVFVLKEWPKLVAKWMDFPIAVPY